MILRPATVYGPGSTEVVGEIARAIRGGHMLLVGRGRALAGLCYVENLIDAALLAIDHRAAPGEAFNVTDGLAVTWRRLTDDLADGLGCAGAAGACPTRSPGRSASRSSTAIGCALEHRAQTAPLLSRQAVQVLGIDQEFSNRKLRETLGWEPRVDYGAGLQATLDWLRAEYL